MNIAGFIQHPVDFRLIGPHVRVTLQIAFAIRQGLLQALVGCGWRLAWHTTAIIEIILYASTFDCFNSPIFQCQFILP